MKTVPGMTPEINRARIAAEQAAEAAKEKQKEQEQISLGAFRARRRQLREVRSKETT
jgi:hypothetical protein